MVYVYRFLTLLALTVTPLLAQDPVPGWENLDASELSTVYLLDDMDAETSGTLIRLDPNSLTLLVNGTERRYEIAQVKRLQRRGDSVKNGAVIGAVVGLGMAALTRGFVDCPDGDSCVGGRAAFVVISTGLYAAIGAGIDALISGRTTLYEAPTGSTTSLGRPPGTLQIPPGRAIVSLGFRW